MDKKGFGVFFGSPSAIGLNAPRGSPVSHARLGLANPSRRIWQSGGSSVSIQIRAAALSRSARIGKSEPPDLAIRREQRVDPNPGCRSLPLGSDWQIRATGFSNPRSPTTDNRQPTTDN